MVENDKIRLVDENEKPSNLESTLTDSGAPSPEWLAEYDEHKRKLIYSEARQEVENEYQVKLDAGEAKYQALRTKHKKTLRENDELRSQNRIDGLTQVHNRKHFDEELDKRASQLSRGKSVSLVGMVLMDIDHFKDVNDNYGHPAGDKILKAVAQATKSASRGSADVCRYGGEEFAILYSNADLNDLHVAGERVMDAIYDATKPFEGKGGPITVSIGYGVLTEDDMNDKKDAESREVVNEMFLTAIDGALYQSKKNGRDRMTLATHDSYVTMDSPGHK